MIVRDFNDIVENQKDRVISDAEWSSVRMLLADDKMGFSFHITTIYRGADFEMHYQNHQNNLTTPDVEEGLLGEWLQ